MLRGFMAFAVAVYHLDFLFHPFVQGRFAAYTVKKIGVYGVEGFFIISGFCFFHLYGAELLRWPAARAFHIKRFFRIAPLYYLAVAANILLGLPAGPHPGPRMVLENATFTFGFIQPNHALVVGGWSIGLEYLFYFAFPLLAWLAAKSRPFLVLATLALLVASAPISFIGLNLIPTPDARFHLYVNIANHAFLFLMGGVIAQARRALPARLSTGAFLVLGAALLLAFTLRYRNFFDDWEIMIGLPRYYFILVTFAVVALFAFYDFPDGLLKTAGRFLGEVSYSVYLLHPLVQAGILHFAPKPYAPWSCFLAGLGLTLGLSWVTFRYVERPMMALGRRLVARG